MNLTHSCAFKLTQNEEEIPGQYLEEDYPEQDVFLQEQAYGAFEGQDYLEREQTEYWSDVPREYMDPVRTEYWQEEPREYMSPLRGQSPLMEDPLTSSRLRAPVAKFNPGRPTPDEILSVRKRCTC